MLWYIQAKAESKAQTTGNTEATARNSMGRIGMIKMIMYDLLIDLMGGAGITLSISPAFMDTANDLIKVIAGIGGIVLLIYSIQLKRLLIKREKEQNGKEEKKEG